MNIPFSMFLIQGIPEQIAVAMLALIFSKVTYKWSEVILLGIGLASAAFLVRMLPITFGVHTVLLIGILFTYLNIKKKIELSRAILAALASYLLLILLESLCITGVMYLFHLSKELIISSTFLRIVITFPHVIFLYILAFLLKKRFNKGVSDVL